MTFLTILGVEEILCRFRLVLEGKTSKEIPKPSRLEFLERFSANDFVFSDSKDNTSRPLNRRAIADLLLLRKLFGICQKSRELSFCEVMGSFVLLAYASLVVPKTLLQRLLVCLNFTWDSEDLSFWYKRDKWFLWTMATAQSAENHGDKWAMTWYFRWGIYPSIPMEHLK